MFPDTISQLTTAEISRIYLVNLSNPNAVKPADETTVTVHGFSPHRGRSSPAPAR